MSLSPNLTETVEWLRSAEDEISFDIETIGKHIRCISLAKGPISCPHSICIPFMKFQVAPDINTASSYWTAQNEITVLEELAKVMDDINIKKIGQNSILFDAPLIEELLRIKIHKHYFDTMHAWHLLYPELPMNLDFLTSILTEYPNYWTNKVTSIDMSEWRYCSMDSISTLVCSHKIREEIESSGMSDLYYNHIHPFAFSLANAQTVGIGFDTKRRDEILKEQEEILKNISSKISVIAKKEININSPPQVMHLLYEEMNYPKIYKKNANNKQVVTCDEDALRRLEQKYPDDPLLDLIVTYRKTAKLISTYLRQDPDPDGMMRTSWNLSGTENGRISSSKTIWKTGLNMQNIPKGKSRGVTNIRDIFIAGRTECKHDNIQLTIT
jgi:DNA polymerase I-like protein with 3'-5' exonuclease and polymerase domains